MRLFGKDPVTPWLFSVVLAYVLFFSLGLPLWDDDFTSIFRKIEGEDLWQHLGEWLSPLSSQAENWAFNERPVQKIIYRFCHLISGYDSWSYFLFKSLAYAGAVSLVYLWARRLVPEGRHGRRAALGGAALFALAPGTMASQVVHSDIAPVAELLFFALTYVIWAEVERTPKDWRGMPRLGSREQARWLGRWTLISLCTYLSYKSKADTKLIPAVLAAYVLVLPERRCQWRFFAVPVVLMALLAVPWGPGIFSRLPPFLPGSDGSRIDWMWQPANLATLREFFWSSEPYSFLTHLSRPTLSLAGLLGPFLLGPLACLLIMASGGPGSVPWLRRDRPEDRARIFVLLWAALVFAAVSALPPINYVFRVRYGILTMGPVSLLIAWALGALVARRRLLPRWGLAAAAVAVGLQGGVNFYRSAMYRRELGSVVTAVDQAYAFMEREHRSERLALFPEFLPYDYRPGSGPWFAGRARVAGVEELIRRFPEEKTYVLSWSASLSERLEHLALFSGCSDSVPFDRIFPCPKGTGAHLMKLIGSDPDYVAGEKLRAERKFAESAARHGAFLARHPGSLGGRFVLGLALLEHGMPDKADPWYAEVEELMPGHYPVVYNRALVRLGLGDHAGAAWRLEGLDAREGANYAVMMNLFIAYERGGRGEKARSMLRRLRERFPGDPEVRRLLAERGG